MCKTVFLQLSNNIDGITVFSTPNSINSATIRCVFPVVFGNLNPPESVKMPVYKQVAMVFGEPMDFSHLSDSDDPKTLRKVTDEIMEALQLLSGQEYVDIYATAAKAKIAREERENSRNSDRQAEGDEENE
jgi:hypothetical protein